MNLRFLFAASIVLAATPAAADETAVDHASPRTSGPILAAGLGLSTNAWARIDGELGWRINRWVAPMAQAHVVAIAEGTGASELGVGARVWPIAAHDNFYIEPRVGRLYYDAEVECFRSGHCVGGRGHGLTAGLAAGVDVWRSDYSAIELRGDLTGYWWRDGGSDQPCNDTKAGLSLVLTFR